MRKWLHHILGIEDLEQRIGQIEKNGVELSLRTVEAQTTLAALRCTAGQPDQEEAILAILRGSSYTLTPEAFTAVSEHLKIADLVQQYGLQRYVPPDTPLPSA